MSRGINKSHEDDQVDSGMSYFKWLLVLIPIALSLLALYISAKTYYIAYRPYVGLVGHNYELFRDENGEPVAMVWRFVMKNTGAVPAIVTLVKNLTQLTHNKNIVNLPSIGKPQGQILLMPNQTSDITGHFSDRGGHAKVRDVLNGTTILTVEIELSYKAIAWSWWKDIFTFKVRNRFRHDYVPPAFIMESGFAD